MLTLGGGGGARQRKKKNDAESVQYKLDYMRAVVEAHYERTPNPVVPQGSLRRSFLSSFFFLFCVSFLSDVFFLNYKKWYKGECGIFIRGTPICGV